MKKINLKKILLFMVITIMLYQDSFYKLYKYEFINYIDEAFILITFIFSLFKLKLKIPKEVIKIWGFMILFYLIGLGCCLAFSSYNKTILLMAPILMIKFFLLVTAIILIAPKEETTRYIIDCLKIHGVISLIAGGINLLFCDFWLRIIPYTHTYFRFGFNS